MLYSAYAEYTLTGGAASEDFTIAVDLSTLLPVQYTTKKFMVRSSLYTRGMTGQHSGLRLGWYNPTSYNKGNVVQNQLVLGIAQPWLVATNTYSYSYIQDTCFKRLIDFPKNPLTFNIASIEGANLSAVKIFLEITFELAE